MRRIRGGAVIGVVLHIRRNERPLFSYLARGSGVDRLFGSDRSIYDQERFSNDFARTVFARTDFAKLLEVDDASAPTDENGLRKTTALQLAKLIGTHCLNIYILK